MFLLTTTDIDKDIIKYILDFFAIIINKYSLGKSIFLIIIMSICVLLVISGIFVIPPIINWLFTRKDKKNMKSIEAKYDGVLDKINEIYNSNKEITEHYINLAEYINEVILSVNGLVTNVSKEEFVLITEILLGIGTNLTDYLKRTVYNYIETPKEERISIDILKKEIINFFLTNILEHLNKFVIYDVLYVDTFNTYKKTDIETLLYLFITSLNEFEPKTPDEMNECKKKINEDVYSLCKEISKLLLDIYFEDLFKNLIKHTKAKILLSKTND